MSDVRRDLNQFHDHGYVVLERVLPEDVLHELRAECDTALAAHVDLMDQVGATTLGLSHKHRRYSLPTRHAERPAIASFLFGDVAFDIVRSALGEAAFLFLELFAVKWPETGTPLGWHQDSGYLLGTPHRPYVSLWVALDDMTAENGSLSILPYDRAGGREVVPHRRDRRENDYVGYSGQDPGVLLTMPAGSVVVLSSTLFHRSGANVSPHRRRAFLASYSSEPIVRDGQLWNQAVPFIRDGARVS